MHLNWSSQGLFGLILPPALARTSTAPILLAPGAVTVHVVPELQVTSLPDGRRPREAGPGDHHPASAQCAIAGAAAPSYSCAPERSNRLVKTAPKRKIPEAHQNAVV